MKKSISILLILVLTLTFTACKKEEPPVQIDFDTWFNSEISPAYDAFVKTEYGKKNAPVLEISQLLINPDYLKNVLQFIKDGTQPTDGTITEANGIYTYKEPSLTQTFEFDNNTCSIRVKSTMIFNGESKPQFTITMREKDDVFYIQYLSSEFRTYYEISFTANGGSVKTSANTDLPYSIFAAEIPETFAKEN